MAYIVRTEYRTGENRDIEDVVLTGMFETEDEAQTYMDEQPDDEDVYEMTSEYVNILKEE